tara:strand:- start:8 stop:421 length:414 start_codon:yes stop_codon:yes gene_type:complete
MVVILYIKAEVTLNFFMKIILAVIFTIPSIANAVPITFSNFSYDAASRALTVQDSLDQYLGWAQLSASFKPVPETTGISAAWRNVTETEAYAFYEALNTATASVTAAVIQAVAAEVAETSTVDETVAAAVAVTAVMR